MASEEASEKPREPAEGRPRRRHVPHPARKRHLVVRKRVILEAGKGADDNKEPEGPNVFHIHPLPPELLLT